MNNHFLNEFVIKKKEIYRKAYPEGLFVFILSFFFFIAFSLLWVFEIDKDPIIPLLFVFDMLSCNYTLFIANSNQI